MRRISWPAKDLLAGSRHTYVYTFSSLFHVLHFPREFIIIIIIIIIIIRIVYFLTYNF